MSLLRFVINCQTFGSRAASIKRPLLSVDVLCVSETLMLNISEAKRFRSSSPIGSLKESAYDTSIGDVTWLPHVKSQS